MMYSRDQEPKKVPGVNTRVIHHGKSFAEETGTVMPPIFPTSTFEHGNPSGFDYTRSGNPNFVILESVLASLEECKYATVFSSGVSAITAIISSLKSEDIILCEENLYGCTIRLLEQVFNKFGIKVITLDFTEAESIKEIEVIKPQMIWIETPTNPLLKVIDIKQISQAAKSMQIPIIVDNTFATSIIQKPLELGSTISLISTTKYINGHSDALGGAVLTNNQEWHQKMVFAQKSLGLQPSPFDCWLITRGLKTLPLRIERQVANANKIASYLSKNKKVNWIRYPMHINHPQYKIAKEQMSIGGAIISASIKGNKAEIFDFCKTLKYFVLAESLGGVESLICHPASMTHASMDSKARNKIGIDDSLVRLSIGCEDVEDLISDLNQALMVIK